MLRDCSSTNIPNPVPFRWSIGDRIFEGEKGSKGMVHVLVSYSVGYTGAQVYGERSIRQVKRDSPPCYKVLSRAWRELVGLVALLESGK